MKYLQDTSPSAAYDKFVESFFSSIAASVGWSVELVLKKFNANYSASRGTLLLCWRTANIERDEMITDFLDPVYEMWLSEEIAQGTVRAPGWSDQSLKDAWLMGEWAGVPMPNIDPLKTMEADRGYVELGAQTLDDVARNFNGSSGKANRRKNARQYDELPTPPWPRAPIQQIPGGEDDG
jgi:capsid protein